MNVTNDIDGASEDYPDGTCLHRVANSGNSTGKNQIAVVSLEATANLSSTTTFNLYKRSGDTFIRTYVNVIHELSGLRKTLEVNIYADEIS